MYTSMAEVLKENAKTIPNRCFAADSMGRSCSYAEAWEETGAIAGALFSAWGISKGDRVLVQCSQQVDYFIVDLACNLLGAVFVPVEKNAREERILEIAQETRCSLCILEEKNDAVKPCVSYDELWTRAKEDAIPDNRPEMDDVAEILYTTGTTGKSKGIVITNRANLALAENVKYGVDMKDGGVEFVPLPMSHSHGLRTFYANLLNGGTVVISNGVMDVKTVFRLMEQYHVTGMDLSPSAAQVLIRLSRNAFWEKAKGLDYIEIGTAALTEDLKEQLLSNLPGVHLYNFYGSTESGRTCVLDFSVEKEKKNCIGRPSKNAEIVFFDDNRSIVASSKDHPGLLASRGPMNMNGYWENETLTKGVLCDGFVLTNDLGYFGDDGLIYMLGRRDDVINYGGIKISPSEVEEVVQRYQGVAECACVGISDAVSGQVPKLFVVAKDPLDFDMDDFSKFLGEHIDKAKLPKSIEQMEALPRTYNGKVDRKELRQKG